MSSRRLAQAGDVLLAALAQNVPPGTEQQGTRPVIVIANPGRLGPQRFPVIVIVPLTTATGKWAEANPTLYPTLPAGAGGLPARSTVLLDQIQAVDATRVRKYFGTLEPVEYATLRQGIVQMLAL